MLPDLSHEPFICTVGNLDDNQAASASSAALFTAASSCAAASASIADESDSESSCCVEQVLLEEQLVVKATLDGVDGGGTDSMACEAQVMLMSDVMIWTPLHVKAASQQLQLKHVVSVVPMRSNPKAFTILATATPPPPTGSIVAAPSSLTHSGWAIGGLLKSYLTPASKCSGSRSVTLEAASADSCARWALAIKCLVAAVARRRSQEGGSMGAAAHLFDESSINMQVHVPPASWQSDFASAPSLHSSCPACSLPLQQPPPANTVSSWLLPSLSQKSADMTASCGRFCFYTGRWFCRNCHADEAVALPGYAATFFDLQPRPVCRSAAALLQAVEERAVLTLPPSLILQDPSLSLLYLYRVQFKHFRCFLKQVCDLFNAPHLP